MSTYVDTIDHEHIVRLRFAGDGTLLPGRINECVRRREMSVTKLTQVSGRGLELGTDTFREPLEIILCARPRRQRLAQLLKRSGVPGLKFALRCLHRFDVRVQALQLRIDGLDLLHKGLKLTRV